MEYDIGLISHSTFSIICGSSLSSFRILFNEPILRNIQTCTTAEAHRATENSSWTVTLDELDKFVRLIVARGEERTLPIKNVWDNLWDALCSTLLCHVEDFWKS